MPHGEAPVVTLIARPSLLDPTGPRVKFEVLGYDVATDLLELRGRFGNVIRLTKTYARKHYQPMKENEDAVSTGIQTELQGRGKDGSSTGGEQ